MNYKPVTARPAAPPASYQGPTSIPPSRATPLSADDDGDDSLPNGCPNCNATMAANDDLCDACGYHLILKKVIDISEMPKKNRATGFERILQEQLEDPESASNTLLWAKVLGVLVLVCVLSICLGRWWWVGILVAAGIGGWIWARSRQRAAAGTSTVNQDPISVVIWTLFLHTQRILGWRKLEWPFPKARTLILCDPAFDDEELKGLERLSDLEAMDLEGTGITDRAFDHLRGLKHLRFLVVRGTKVTAAGAQRLQEDLPQTLIWYS